MEIKQSFTVARPLDVVWALFQDVPAVATCMPGAELTADKGGGAYAGKVGIRLGPFNAAFEGEAELTTDPATHSGRLEGRGTDKRGGSRSKLVMAYRMSEAAGGTKVDVDADVQLAGPIAQFGRTGIITETANVLIQQFVQNVEAKLASMPGAPTSNAASSAVTVTSSAAASSSASASASVSASASASASAPPALPTPRPAAPQVNQISATKLLRAVLASWLRRVFGRG